MMPLILSKTGEESVILRVGGSPEVRQHLNDLGREMAQKIMVQ